MSKAGCGGRKSRGGYLIPAAGCLVAVLCSTQARAQFSGKDGYAPDGSYRPQFELSPYLWLPATSASFSLGPRGQITGSSGAGVPTAREVANFLHGAFMGFGLVRYGPWSGEIDIQWVDASQGKSFQSDRLGPINVSASASYVRVAPGFGYEIYSNSVAGMPLTVDARAGFAWFEWSAKIGSERNLLGGLSESGSFVQPWLGARGTLYPSQDWRLELGLLAQGFGVSGGSWGWGASILASYSVTTWLDITGGFRAIRSARYETEAGITGRGNRSLDFTAYGPVLGVGFRF